MVSGLEEKGYLTVERRHGEPNVYAVKVPCSDMQGGDTGDTPPERLGGDTGDTGGVTSTTQRGDTGDTQTIEPKRTLSKNKREKSFQIFWGTYPKIEAQPSARKEWDRLGPTNGLVETILADIRSRLDGDEWTRENGRFIPRAAKYISERRWEDSKPEGQRFTPEEIAAAKREDAELRRKHLEA